MHRLAAGLLVLAAACGGRAPTGPAWPRSAGTEIDPDDDPEDDGGESLDPRQADSVASVEKSSDPAPAVTEPAPATTDTPAPPSTDPPATTPPEEPVPAEPVLEEIVIEVKPD